MSQDSGTSDDRVTMRDYVDTRFTALNEQLAQALLTVQRATDRVDAANEKRFESVNEFRQSVAQQQRALIPRPEYEMAHASLQRQVNDMATALANAKSEKKGAGHLWAVLLGAAGGLLTLLHIVGVIKIGASTP